MLVVNDNLRKFDLVLHISKPSTLWYERVVKSHQLVHERTYGPHITLQSVWLTFPNFRSHVVRGALKLSECPCLLRQYFRQAEIAKLVDTPLRAKHVCHLDVPVHDVPIVAVLQAKADLDTDVEQLFLGKLLSQSILVVYRRA